jgi:hypothetical protein
MDTGRGCKNEWPNFGNNVTWKQVMKGIWGWGGENGLMLARFLLALMERNAKGYKSNDVVSC